MFKMSFFFWHTLYIQHIHINTYSHISILKMWNRNQITLVVPPYLMNKKSVSAIIYIQVGENNIYTPYKLSLNIVILLF